VPPFPPDGMTCVRDFIADLARVGKGFLEIEKALDLVYGDKALKKTAIYAILKKVKSGKTTEDQRHFYLKKTVKRPGMVE
jgi:hypothetical protein